MRVGGEIMRLISRCNPDMEFNSFLQEPSCKNEVEYQRLLKVFGVVEKAVHQRVFTSQHTVGVDDISILENRFFGASPRRYLGTEKSVKQEHHDGAPDTVISQNNFVLAVDHFRFDCAKWTRKGSPLQAFLSKHRDQVSSLSGNELIEFVRSNGIRCSEKDYVENLSKMIKAKVEKTSRYFKALDCYLVEEDRTKQKELWLFAEDILPIGDIDLVISEVLRQFDAHPKLAGVIYARNAMPFVISENIDDIRFIYNRNSA